MLVVDFMHETELGIWKSLFIHLLRILDAAKPGGKLLGMLDERCKNSMMGIVIGLILSHDRFRIMPLFSQTISRFSDNASEMKKLAAQDFEDLLQVGLLPSALYNILIALLSVPSWHLKVCWRGLMASASLTNTSSDCCIGP